MEKNYFNGGCVDCMFAERDERGRFVSSCSGYSNCSWEKFEGEVDPLTEEEKDQRISELEKENSRLQEQAGHIVFTDGYDENDNPIHTQVFKTYKERCEELEIKLKNAIVPKYHINQGVYVVYCGKVLGGEVAGVSMEGLFPDDMNFSYNIYFDNSTDEDFEEKYVFSTEAEAKQFLEEHRNEPV